MMWGKEGGVCREGGQSGCEEMQGCGRGLPIFGGFSGLCDDRVEGLMGDLVNDYLPWSISFVANEGKRRACEHLNVGSQPLGPSSS